MACNSVFYATIFCEQLPEIEFRDGLFHVVQKVGGVTLRRVFLPCMFVASVRLGQEALAKWRVEQLDTNVVPMRH